MLDEYRRVLKKPKDPLENNKNKLNAQRNGRPRWLLQQILYVQNTIQVDGPVSRQLWQAGDTTGQKKWIKQIQSFFGNSQVSQLKRRKRICWTKNCIFFNDKIQDKMMMNGIRCGGVIWRRNTLRLSRICKSKRNKTRKLKQRRNRKLFNLIDIYHLIVFNKLLLLFYNVFALFFLMQILGMAWLGFVRNIHRVSFLYSVRNHWIEWKYRLWGFCILSNHGRSQWRGGSRIIHAITLIAFI